MKTSFVAFLNKRGLACASDTDMTLYALSRQEPVALAVNSYSPIPWDFIINSYLRKGEIQIHETFSDYARDFACYLSTVETKPSWKYLSSDEKNIIFLGYGSDDVFPSAVDIMVKYDEEAKKLICDFDIDRGIDHINTSDFFMLSHFENTQPVMYGIIESARQKLIDKQNSLLDTFKERIFDAVKGTEFEKAVQEVIAEYDSYSFEDVTRELSGQQMQRVDTAIDSFNIEDLVKVAEDFVDAKVQIDHLKNGGRGDLHYTKELAVITRTEGVVWIKHCLYGI
jgi:hypothetical protein